MLLRMESSSARSETGPLLVPFGARPADTNTSTSGIGERRASGDRNLDKSAESVAQARTIVIVDDEEDIIAALSLMVRNWGYVVEATASDGSQVVDAISQKKIRPEVVLMDYRMKTMNGLEAAERIRLFDPSIRIILESADDAIEAEVTKAGFAFLRKPFTASQLRSALGNALGEQKSEP
jgi:CheY-like chemotaxis protein